MSLYQLWHSVMHTFNQIYVICVHFSSHRHLLANATTILSAEELERAKKILIDTHREKFIISRAILRSLLGTFLDCPAAQVTFAYHPHGKPYLAPDHCANLQFNLSHSNDRAIYVFRQDKAVGIDIEKIVKRDCLALAKRFFCEEEVLHLEALAPLLQFRAFYELWCRKEALIKAAGFSLLGSIQACLLPLEAQPSQHFFAKQHWEIRPLLIDTQYACALASPAPIGSIECFYLDQNNKFSPI